MTKRKRRHRRSVDVRINWLQPYAEGFKEWLDERNYSPATIIEVVRLLALWADWVRAKGFELETLDAGLAASASVFRGSKKPRAPQGAAKLFITYLRNEGVLPPAHEPSLEETWPELAAFRHWMREERGIMESTLDTYQQTLTDLLAALGTDPAAYTATAIRDFVLERAKPHGIGRARGITVATRAYLKYLVAIGQCPIGREHAVPTFASWQLATVPRFLGQADIDRLLASCEGKGRLRDRAIILLLARLGFLSGRTIATSMAVVRPGTIGPAPFRAETTWKAAGGRFFVSRCKAQPPHAACRMGWLGGGKKLAAGVAGRRARRSRSSVRPCQIEDANGAP